VSDDRGQMMFDILLGIQRDVLTIRHEVELFGRRLTSLERLMHEWPLGFAGTER
jgi:hypothetical protein